VLKRASQFRPGPPYNLHTKKYADDLNEVKALGGDGITTPSTRTPEQTEIGRFWIESSPFAWNRLTRDVAAGRGLDSWENARLFGLLNLALADGYIASWDTKFHYLFWRPVTAIHEADHDGNSRTAGDPTWTPLQLTYPMPDYDSGHSVEGGAAAQALADFFGTDAVSFLACSYTLPAGSRCTDPSPVLRSFASFGSCRRECAVAHPHRDPLPGCHRGRCGTGAGWSACGQSSLCNRCVEIAEPVVETVNAGSHQDGLSRLCRRATASARGASALRTSFDDDERRSKVGRDSLIMRNRVPSRDTS
jgi:hypothetical protein